MPPIHALLELQVPPANLEPMERWVPGDSPENPELLEWLELLMKRSPSTAVPAHKEAQEPLVRFPSLLLDFSFPKTE